MIEFVVHRNGRIDAMLGHQRIGVIEPHQGDAEMYYRVLLHGDEHSTAPRPAISVTTARRQLLHRLAEWFAEAGLLRLSQEIGKQAERERETA